MYFFTTITTPAVIDCLFFLSLSVNDGNVFDHLSQCLPQNFIIHFTSCLILKWCWAALSFLWRCKWYVNSQLTSADVSFFRRWIQMLPERLEKVVASDGQYLPVTFLSLRFFEQLSSSLLFFPQRFGLFVLLPPNSGADTELQTTSCIESIRVACSDSVGITEYKS